VMKTLEDALRFTSPTFPMIGFSLWIPAEPGEIPQKETERVELLRGFLSK